MVVSQITQATRPAIVLQSGARHAPPKGRKEQHFALMNITPHTTSSCMLLETGRVVAMNVHTTA